MLMSENTKELLNYLYVAFEEIEKKQLIALDIQTLFTWCNYDIPIVNRESMAMLEEVKTKMRRESEIELDPELLSPMQTLGFMIDVMRKADES